MPIFNMYTDFMRKVLAFGAFDPLHKGHEDFLRQAKGLGEYLIVVVARDSAIRMNKGHEPYKSENRRLEKVAAVEYVDEAMLGTEAVHHYEMLSELDFQVLALGYDQTPSDEVVRAELGQRGKSPVQVIRLKPFHPEAYKSTYLRPGE